MSCQSQGQEGSEGDAEQGDAAGVDCRARRDPVDGVVSGVEPQGEVVAVGDRGGVGSTGAGAVEVVDRVERHAKLLCVRAEAIEPEVDIATGAMQKEDGGQGAGTRRLGDVDLDGPGPAHKDRHAREMRGGRRPERYDR